MTGLLVSASMYCLMTEAWISMAAAAAASVILASAAFQDTR